MSDISKQLNRANLINKFSENTEKKKPDNPTVQYLQARFNLLERYWTEFYNGHSKLMLSEDFEKTDYYKDGIFDDIENDYILNLSQLQEQIDELKSTVNSNVNLQSSLNSVSRRIPILSVPKFSGSQSDWETFKELFCSIIKNDINLTPVEKLQHLLNSVEGPAASSLKGIKVIGTNFNVAWDKLLRRYDNSRLRLSTHLDCLINLNYVSKKCSADINCLLDAADEAIKGLTDLGCPVDEYDVWLVHLITRKLDSETREDWEISQENCKGFSSYDSLRKFLESRVRSLEQAQFSATSVNFKDRKNFGSSYSSKYDNKINFTKTKSVSAHMAKNSKFIKSNSQSKIVCKFCSGLHKLRDCESFKRSSVDERRNKVIQLKLCLNCLDKNHRAADCPSTARCFICDERHHVKLHIDKIDTRTNGSAVSDETTNDLIPTRTVCFGAVGSPILLATAQIILKSSSGDNVFVRALVDPGAEASFISQRAADILCLPRQEANIVVSGVGASKSGTAKMKTYVTVLSKINHGFSLSVPMLILNKLTADIPNCMLKTNNWSHLSKLALADPHYFKKSQVDCILGADVYGTILKDGVVRGPPNTPVAQETYFGWILTGLTSGNESLSNTVIQSLHVSLEPPVASCLEKFWEIEQVPGAPILSEEEEFCERLYRNTTVRNSEGRYVVKLPVKMKTEFPYSKSIALSCLLKGAKRLSKYPELKQKYSEFMKEYEDLGHMQSSTPVENNLSLYYLPHHSVVGTNGKLRVVFNASQKCSSGISLNDILYPGPKLQQELSAVICRWRMGRYAFVCDIVKMFRQILVAEEDLILQRILWKPDFIGELMEFILLTVTYGTAPAPFLAIRTLLQLADDEESVFPEAAHLLRKLSYVDDIYGSGHTLEATVALRNQLIKLLASAGMSLSKWSANNIEVLNDLSENSTTPHAFDLNTSVSTLGLLWYPGIDCFSFKVSLASIPYSITKRTILSDIAKLFDPLGWLGPVVVRGKILLQDLWISGIDWDTNLSNELSIRWLEMREDLLSIQQIQIPRWLGGLSDSPIEVHGFCDASSRAYAAAVYLKTGHAQPLLLMSKTKVAPLKTLSIPRLELCGALLLARLLHFIIKELPISTSGIQCYTDSSVVLAWLNKHPSKWTTFVANRVSEILELLPNIQWKYVPTSENPADCASRGMSANQLKDFALWWNGPVWLANETSQEQNIVHFETELEMKAQSAAYTVQTDQWKSILDFLQGFSSLSKITAILAYIRRWLRKFRKLKIGSSYLSGEEINDARMVLWRLVQWEHFVNDIRLLEKHLPLARNSPLVRLKPFFDEKLVLRLGGRLQYSELPFDEKHPIILPKDSHFSRLLVEEAHSNTLHGGPQLMQSYLHRSHWIVQSKRLIQSVYRSCPRCLRFTTSSLKQQMAPLPNYRLTPQRPFAITGLDYAGAFSIRAHKGRGHVSSKGYVAVFVCMVTRAIHLEVVSDLTTAAFLAAYRRFTSRRGNCSMIYSDNGTTFRGAASELNDLFSTTSNFSKELAEMLARDGTSWSFIPPRAPHFGGLWEAAVKSFKHHLKRVVGDTKLTFEEFSTLTAEIEACLNSRPLCPISNNAEDVVALTPGHFLIGSSLKAPPEPFTEVDLSKSFVSRWKHLLVMRNHFWMRWRKEVLQQLQQRNKWLASSDPLQVDDLVLIKDEQLPPTRWSMGRITQLYPGSDGLVRVAEIRTASSQLRRPLVKLIKLLGDPAAVSAYTTM